MQHPQQLQLPIVAPTTNLKAISYAAPIQTPNLKEISYSAPIQYAYPAIQPGPHVTRFADKVEIIQKPIEQHGYVVKY